MNLSASSDAYTAARIACAFLDRVDRGRIVVSGTERASYLQGLLTNDIVALGPGRGCYAAYLTPQGRMIADLYVYELGDVILLVTEREVKDTVMSRLDQFIFGEDVQLGDVTETFGEWAAIGPDAARILASTCDGVTIDALAVLPEHGNLRAAFAGQPIVVARVTDTGEPGFDVFLDSAQSPAFAQALASAGAVPLDEGTAEVLRVEAGVPRFHKDMDEETIPLEAGIEGRAISFTKGCYVGQEVIIRVLHRGHGRVARRLVGLALDDGPVPEAGAAVSAEGQDVGRVTSAVMSPRLSRPIALAYVRRDSAEPGTVLSVAGVCATVSALPFTGSSRSS